MAIHLEISVLSCTEICDLFFWLAGFRMVGSVFVEREHGSKTDVGTGTCDEIGGDL